MTNEKRQPIDDASAWTGAELAASDDWIWELDAEEVAEIETALAHAKTLNRPWQELTAADFPLDRVAAGLRETAERLEHGRGVALIRGIPVDRYEGDDLKRLYFGLGCHAGVPVIQNGAAGMMREVRDTGGPRVESTGALNWHNDRADVVALLCVRGAAAGGVSRIASATALYNTMLERRPDLVDVLFGDFYRNSSGDEVGTEVPYYLLPVFNAHDGVFTSDLSRTYIEQAQAFPEVPRLTEAQVEALDLIFTLSDELCFEHTIEPGEIQMLNNHVTYHGRTAFEDDATARRDRFLLRLWLMMPDGRRLPKDQASLWSSAELTQTRLSEFGPGA